jgi:LPS sulfotransferase NodH
MESERIKNENEIRKSKYSKDLNQENFFKEMNITLQKVEEKNYKNYAIKFPFIHIFGIPRSGTTLLTQFIAQNLEVGYFDNLSARFWLAPIHGIKLSKSVLNNTTDFSYNSTYGRTSEINSPHEFGYFWQNWLKMAKEEDFVYPSYHSDSIAWDKLRTVLSNIQHEFNLSVMFKNFFGLNYFDEINNASEKPVWIYIKRDIIDSAISIYNARLKYYNDANIWWSTKPPEYFDLKDKNGYEQVAGQVFHLDKFYEKLCSKNPDKIIQISYKNLCENPKDVLLDIVKRINDLYDYKINIKEKELSFKFETYNHNDYPEIVDAINKLK